MGAKLTLSIVRSFSLGKIKHFFKRNSLYTVVAI